MANFVSESGRVGAGQADHDSLKLFTTRPFLRVDRASVPSPIAFNILMDTMARDRAHMYLFFV